jgi:transcriptional regulator with XRE-family HTH domain
MNVSLANKLSSMRTAAGLTEAAAASAAGVTTETLKSWEHGEGSPTLAESVTLSRIYGVDISQFARSADLSQGISLKKSQSVPISGDHGVKFTPYSEGYMREKIPDKYTDEEIYPKPQKQTVQNNASASGFIDAPAYGTQSGAPYTGGYYSGGVGTAQNGAQTTYAEPQKSPGGINIEVVENRINQAVSGAAAHMPAAVAAAEKIFRKTGELIDTAAEKARQAMENAPAPGDYPPPLSKRERKREALRQRREKQQTDEAARAEYKAYKKKVWRKSSLLYKCFPLLMTAGFFASIPLGLAHIAWLGFLLIPLYYGFHNAIRHRDMKRFPYPLVPLILFLLTALLDGDPAWALWFFVTIPFYYILIDHIRGKRE